MECRECGIKIFDIDYIKECCIGCNHCEQACYYNELDDDGYCYASCSLETKDTPYEKECNKDCNKECIICLKCGDEGE